jgi:hypothetical protein
MANERRVLMLEFNELAPPLMDRFMTDGQLPNFRRLHSESQIYITEATERGWDLNPWIQWVTVHSGVDFRVHGITELDEGGKLQAHRIWDVVSEAGLSVWVCGSMNVAYQKLPRGIVMPDPWTTKVSPYPESLRPFFRFVQQNVLDHTSDQVALTWKDYVAFATFMLSHGLSLRSVLSTTQQLIAERFGNLRWKRAALLDKLQFDVFRWYYRKERPHFATFFSNSTAHYQHFYWREMEPELFKIQPTPEKRTAYETAILYGYKEMDKLIGRFLDLADDDTIIVFATALSQQPCLVYEDQGGKIMYRPRDFSKLMQIAGVEQRHTIAPLMAEVFNIQLGSEEDAICVEEKLRSLRLGEKRLMHVERKGAVLNAKCAVHDLAATDALITGTLKVKNALFRELFYRLEEIKSGMHHPDGMLWIRMPERRHRLHPDKVCLASVAPTILELLSLPRPSHMHAPTISVS